MGGRRPLRSGGSRSPRRPGMILFASRRRLRMGFPKKIWALFDAWQNTPWALFSSEERAQSAEKFVGEDKTWIMDYPLDGGLEQLQRGEKIWRVVFKENGLVSAHVQEHYWVGPEGESAMVRVGEEEELVVRCWAPDRLEAIKRAEKVKHTHEMWMKKVS